MRFSATVRVGFLTEFKSLFIFLSPIEHKAVYSSVQLYKNKCMIKRKCYGKYVYFFSNFITSSDERNTISRNNEINENISFITYQSKHHLEIVCMSINIKYTLYVLLRRYYLDSSYTCQHICV